MFVWFSKYKKKYTDFNGQSLSGYGVVFYAGYVFKHSLDNRSASNSIAFGVDNQKDKNM